MASAVEGLTRCGWSVVEVSLDGVPLRAVYGPLPGRVQTVPRSEYYAMLQALSRARQPAHVVSDHLSLVNAGNRWGVHNERAGAAHANIWRQAHNVYRQSAAPPTFEWTPAHKDFESVSTDPSADVLNFVGNAWADMFAKWGSRSHAVPEALVDFHKRKLQEAKATAK
eukprot:1904751-Pyramimonas_sp.AAC.1